MARCYVRAHFRPHLGYRLYSRFVRHKEVGAYRDNRVPSMAGIIYIFFTAKILRIQHSAKAARSYRPYPIVLRRTYYSCRLLRACLRGSVKIGPKQSLGWYSPTYHLVLVAEAITFCRVPKKKVLLSSSCLGHALSSSRPSLPQALP